MGIFSCLEFDEGFGPEVVRDLVEGHVAQADVDGRGLGATPQVGHLLATDAVDG